MNLKLVYETILADDTANIQEIAEITKGKSATLDTPNKRALFLFGYRNPQIRIGCTLDTDTENERFLPLDFGATDNDAFYIACGRRYPRKK